MRKWILFVGGMALIFLGIVLFKSKENVPVVEPITLEDTTQIKFDIHMLEKAHQNNKLLPRPKQKDLVIKFPKKQGDKKESDAVIRVEQELLFQDKEVTDDEEEKNSFSQWIKQKLYGIKIRLKLPF